MPPVSTEIRKQRSRTAPVVLCGIVITLVLAIASARLFSLLRAASLLYALSPESPRLVQLWTSIFGQPVEETERTITARNGFEAVRIIAPVGRPNAPVVLLVTGLVPQGFHDPALTKVARRLAQMGVRVVLPDLSAERQLLIRTSDLDAMGTALQWAATTYHQRVSLIGISFGGGLVLAVAGMRQYAPYVKLVLSEAGYDNLNRLCHYYIGDRVVLPDGSAYREKPGPERPEIIAFQYLDEMVPAEDVASFHAIILAQLLNKPSVELEQLTPEQARLFQDLHDVRSPQMRKHYHELLDRHAAEMRAISPETYLATLHAPVYLLHGIHDTCIPEGEVAWTLHDLPAGSDEHAMLSSWLNHATLNGQTSRWEKIRVANFLLPALKTMLRPMPLH